MMDITNQQTYTVGIIGGGKVGLDLFRLFSQSKFAQVIYVVDRDIKAPAILAAQNTKIATFQDIDIALNNPTDLVIEVTGSKKVVEILQEKIGNTCGKVITHDMAFIILQVIEESNKKLRVSVISESEEIKHAIDDNLNETSIMIDSIENVTSEMRILALNARIEAARVGDAGKGFALVAEQMGKLTDEVRNIAKQMEKITLSVKSMSDKINITIGKLR
jgi:methyl-accepting chemotaxis protein